MTTPLNRYLKARIMLTDEDEEDRLLLKGDWLFCYHCNPPFSLFNHRAARYGQIVEKSIHILNFIKISLPDIQSSLCISIDE